MNCVNGIRAVVEAHAQLKKPAVLATVIDTRGSSYRKAGARMLIHADEVTGIVGGGCFDDDLIAQARQVHQTGEPQTVLYDMTSPDDVLWGLGMGCNGAVTVFLQPVGPGISDDPLPLVAELVQSDAGGYVATVVDCQTPDRLGASWIVGDGQPGPAMADAGLQKVDDELGLFVDHVEPPPKLGIFGAGADALPLADIAAQTGWLVEVWDHRPGFAVASRFPMAERVSVFADEKPEGIERCFAVVVMSHSFAADLRFLNTVADVDIPYVGVLGPVARRQMLLEQMGDKGPPLESRLRGPIGLDLGGELPEEIALSVVSEIQLLRYRGSGRQLSP
ncbi:MAG: XdhC family protein [Xanthomonadales bacterium]|nr:XdhC family protein [Xanthomonadales bacterium]